MSRISHAVEAILFRSRFLLAPLYLGLVGALGLLAYRFVIEFWHLAEKTASMNASEFTLALLALLDENFVSRIDIATESKDRPHWMGTIDFSGLKIKLIGSLVAISVIELLKDFIELAGEAEVGEGTIWRIAIHLTFVVSGVLFALMDWIADKREFVGTH